MHRLSAKNLAFTCHTKGFSPSSLYNAFLKERSCLKWNICVRWYKIWKRHPWKKVVGAQKGTKHGTRVFACLKKPSSKSLHHRDNDGKIARFEPSKDKFRRWEAPLKSTCEEEKSMPLKHYTASRKILDYCAWRLNFLHMSMSAGSKHFHWLCNSRLIKRFCSELTFPK